MAPNKRDEPKTPQGKKGKIPTGGKAGRTPGLGTRNNVDTTPGGSGRSGPAKGYGLSTFRTKPSTEPSPDPNIKPKDEK